MAQLNVRIPDTLRRRLKTAAAESDTTITSIVIRAIRAYLAEGDAA